MLWSARVRSALSVPLLLLLTPMCLERVLQGFGKRKNMVGTRRPKKKKVEVATTSEPSALDGDDGDYVAEKVAQSNVGAPLGETSGTRPESPEFNDREQRKTMAHVVKEVRKLVAEAKVRLRVAEAAQRAEVRRDEERTKRWWAAWQREEPPPAYLQLERAYKSQVKGLEAALEVSHAQMIVARAETALQESLLDQEKCAHDRTRAKLVEASWEAP